MRLLLPISVSLLLAWQAARAQTADDFFNSGAHAYISNNIPSALQSTEAGLKQFPDDVKLKKLYELLKQQQQQQSQNSQSQQNQNQQSQQQKSSGQQNQQQRNQQNSQEQQKQNEQNQSGQKNSEQQNQQQQSSGQKQQNQNEQNQQTEAGQMTPEEAKRLLDAQKGDEQILQMQPPGKSENQNQPIKDW